MFSIGFGYTFQPNISGPTGLWPAAGPGRSGPPSAEGLFAHGHGPVRAGPGFFGSCSFLIHSIRFLLIILQHHLSFSRQPSLKDVS